MKLKMVEIYGFKSFAQRTELSFDKGITGIVGPNGSGKSNIGDAVRWVLGEQSARLLRGSKMEDVIFGGTEKRKALPYCEVSLLFDNEDQTLNSPYAEVLVTRRVYRSGEGEYFLNKTNCRLKDIVELFRDTGIGKEGYSIIGQGRVEEILSTKGEERRAVFEEAAGIVTFRIRKEEAERKLARTAENLMRLQDILEELGSRLEGLEQQASTAKQYLAMSEQLKDLEVNAFLVRHDRLQERIRSLKQLVAGLEESIQQQEDDLKKQAASRTQTDSALDALETRDTQQRQTLHEAQTLESDLAQQLQSNLGDQASAHKEQERLTAEKEDTARRYEELQSLLHSSSDDAEGHRAALERLDARLSLEEEALQKILETAAAAEATLDAHKQQYVDAINRLGDRRAAHARQEAMLRQMEQRRAELVEEASNLDIAVLEARAHTAKTKDLGEQVRIRHAELEAEERTLLESVQTAADSASSLMERAQSVSAALQSSNGRLTILSDMVRDYEGYGQAVKRALLHAGRNPKVHGIVADILRVPEQYETAIEMILGGTLQHIVTDDEETAKELIDYLRSNRLGRTTFLPISAVRGRGLTAEERRILNDADVFGVASELVQHEARFANIISSVLGRTVIVRDLDAAIRLSRRAGQSYNVVTLAGDVMRAGGAMTGGTSQARTTSLLSRQREMDMLKSQIAGQQQELQEIMDQHQQAKGALLELQRLHHEASEALSQESIAMAREVERQQNALKDEQTIAARKQAIDGAVSQLLSSMQEIESDLQQAQQQSEASNLDKAEMEAHTIQLQQDLHGLRIQAEEVRQNTMRLAGEKSSLAHEGDLLTRDRKRWQDEMNSLAHRNGHLQRELDDLTRQLSQTIGHEAQLRTALDDAKKQTSLLNVQAEALRAERNELLSAQRRLAEQADASHAQITTLTDKLHRNELIITKTENELQTISDHVLNAYDLTYSGAQELRTKDKFDLPAAELNIKEIKQQIRELGMVNVAAIEEYSTTLERHHTLDTQRQDALRAQDDLQQLIAQLLSEMEKQFVTEFEKLNAYFAETFSRLFGGGQAQLVLTDKSQPLTCDIDVAAQPPGKKLQLLSLLSGGERALTAIAILFAMLKLKPTPFCILDEIEAALDEANIGYFADYLSEYARSTQFIVITHRKGTMERCDSLYGVSMVEKGVSSMVSVDLQRFAQ